MKRGFLLCIGSVLSVLILFFSSPAASSQSTIIVVIIIIIISLLSFPKTSSQTYNTKAKQVNDLWTVAAAAATVARHGKQTMTPAHCLQHLKQSEKYQPSIAAVLFWLCKQSIKYTFFTFTFRCNIDIPASVRNEVVFDHPQQQLCSLAAVAAKQRSRVAAQQQSDRKQTNSRAHSFHFHFLEHSLEPRQASNNRLWLALNIQLFFHSRIHIVISLFKFTNNGPLDVIVVALRASCVAIHELN